MNHSVSPPHPLPTRLLLVEDHPVYREGLIAALERGLPGARCRGVATAREALAALAVEAGLDAVLVDIGLPDGDGLALVAEVRRRWPGTVCLVVSGRDDAHALQRAVALGCLGFLPKMLESGELVRRVARVLAGEPSFPGGQRQADAKGLCLTERQLAVLDRVARGMTSRLIGVELGISERTVKDHLAVIYARLDASTRAQAVAHAAVLGVLPQAASLADGASMGLGR